MFQINSIVKGKVCGVFVVLNRRLAHGETYYDLKSINPYTQQTERGQLSLPESALDYYK